MRWLLAPDLFKLASSLDRFEAFFGLNFCTAAGFSIRLIYKKTEYHDY
jgi:hypothetical protein